MIHVYKTLPSLTLFASSPPSSLHRSLPRTAGGCGWRTGTRSRPPSPDVGTADEYEKRDATFSFWFCYETSSFQDYDSNAYHTLRCTGRRLPHNLTAQPGKSVNRVKASYGGDFGTAGTRGILAAKTLASRSANTILHPRQNVAKTFCPPPSRQTRSVISPRR